MLSEVVAQPGAEVVEDANGPAALHQSIDEVRADEPRPAGHHADIAHVVPFLGRADSRRASCDHDRDGAGPRRPTKAVKVANIATFSLIPLSVVLNACSDKMVSCAEAGVTLMNIGG